MLFSPLAVAAMMTDVPPRERLGQMLTRYRRHAGLSQRELAGRIGVAPSTLASYEAGVRWPADDVLDRLVTECRLDARELFPRT